MTDQTPSNALLVSDEAAGPSALANLSSLERNPVAVYLGSVSSGSRPTLRRAAALRHVPFVGQGS